jgi:hypothetical protein
VKELNLFIGESMPFKLVWGNCIREQVRNRVVNFGKIGCHDG